MSRTNENKLKMKDIATIGIFSALLFVVTMVAGALMGISMVLNMYSVAVVAVLSAPLYMLIMAKVHKKGAVLLTFAIVGILWGLFGGIFVLIWMLGFGVVGEVLASKSKYQNYKMLTVSFGLYSVGYYLGAIAPLYYYPVFWYGFDRPKETVDAMIAAAHSTAGLAAIPVTLIAIVIGAVIAKRMLKKHSEKVSETCVVCGQVTMCILHRHNRSILPFFCRSIRRNLRGTVQSAVAGSMEAEATAACMPKN